MRDHEDHDGRRASRYEDDRRHERRRRDDEGPRHREDGPPREKRGRGKGKDGMGTPERRSPTPESCLPLSQRRRKASGWDVHAPGYEQYSALQAKQTGMYLY